MQQVVPTEAILVKAASGLPSAKLVLGGTSVNFAATPLFASIGGPRGRGAAAETWSILTPPPGFAETNAWDTCHALMQQGFDVAGAAAPTFAEPDLRQQWVMGSKAELIRRLAQGCDSPNGQNPDFPGVAAKPYWLRDDDHSQFDAALASVGGPDVAAKVRIAHLDSGYDPDHRTLPRRLRRDLARNFVGDGNPDDASDVAGGLIDNLGHGTGTLGLLAGASRAGELGGAPFAEVVPLRIADRLVVFSTASIAQAFDYVHGLNAAGRDFVDIVMLGVGGLASQAWAEAVNALYEQGVFMVAAAGNNFGNVPTRSIVFPARFERLVAACGVMADGMPYADLGMAHMAGNYGPNSKMATAMAAPTPNVPWARLGCPDTVDFDGAGTAAAAAQVAAAAALWVQTNRAALDEYPEPWMRAEAIRRALFAGARTVLLETMRLGQGPLRANDTLRQQPEAASALSHAAPDSAPFPLLRALIADPQADPGPRQRMLGLEALQLSQHAAIEAIVPDAETASPAQLRRLAEALNEHPRASTALRDALHDAARPAPAAIPMPLRGLAAGERVPVDINVNVPPPRHRPLRVFAYDPSLAMRMDTVDINEATLLLRWEENLKPGPVGEYIEVVDYDPASECFYAPVDLNHPHILTQSGLTPSEALPQFHQQMVYAVAMKTIEYFERALGRVALWRRAVRVKDGVVRWEYVQRLRIYPHALRAQNAYFSLERMSLLLGYFQASEVMPGTVFTATSHDIIAHETTHALLDGLRARFFEPTNLDIRAFHEAFADIVALFQHFTLPEALRHQIAATRGDIEQQSLLGQLAAQFGAATGRYGALRDYIGGYVPVKDVEGERPVWRRRIPSPDDYHDATEPHDRGAILVAAVFDTFLQIYKRRTRDLLRLATGGTEILAAGAIPPDLVNRLAQEASKVAGHILNICIRALDYCPPVDLTFGEYLRALITADSDLVPLDEHHYRTAFIAAFRDRGIYPPDVKHLSPDSLVWEPPTVPLRKVRDVLDRMSIEWDLNIDRQNAEHLSQQNAALFWHWLHDDREVSDEEIAALGLVRRPGPYRLGSHAGELRRIEVHSVRPARRADPEGVIHWDVVVELTQTFRPADLPGARFRGGCSLIINFGSAQVRYVVHKRVGNVQRFLAQMALGGADGPRNNYFAADAIGLEPFAALHDMYA